MNRRGFYGNMPGVLLRNLMIKEQAQIGFFHLFTGSE